MNALTTRAWGLYRGLAARYPFVRSVLAPIRWHFHFNYLSYGISRLRGLTYRDWYARVLDNFACTAAPPQMEGLERQMGAFQLEYLVNHGLKPGHSLLDYGCGNLRAGVFLIEYLNPKCYVGADISTGRLAQGRCRIAEFGLEAKLPDLVGLGSMSLDELGGRTVDVIWAQGVLAHMPLADIDALFRNIRKVMHRGSVFYVNYGDGDGRCFKTSMKDFFYDASVIHGICAKYNLVSEPMTDWRHAWPHPLQDRDRMLRVTLK